MAHMPVLRATERILIHCSHFAVAKHSFCSRKAIACPSSKRQYNFAFKFPVIWQMCNFGPPNGPMCREICVTGPPAAKKIIALIITVVRQVHNLKRTTKWNLNVEKRKLVFIEKVGKKNEIQSSYAERTESLEWVHMIAKKNIRTTPSLISAFQIPESTIWHPNCSGEVLRNWIEITMAAKLI